MTVRLSDLPVLLSKFNGHLADEVREQLRDKDRAKLYQCSTRTIRRWRRLGLDVDSPTAIAEHLLATGPSVRLKTYQAVRDLLNQ